MPDSEEVALQEQIHHKTSLIEKCLPAKSVIDFGGMWEVNGLYSRICLDRFKIPKVTMIDDFLSENWKNDLKLRRGIDFRKGDFSDEKFMATIKDKYDIGLAYDVILHQIDLRHTISMMLDKVSKFFLVSLPLLPEKMVSFRNSLILLSGSQEKKLIPFDENWTRKMHYWKNFSDARIVCYNHWLWGMTPSLLESLLLGLGWRRTYRRFLKDWLPPESKWIVGDFIFQRVR